VAVVVGMQDACQGCHPGNELDEPSPNLLAPSACRRPPPFDRYPSGTHGTPSVAAPAAERNTQYIIPYPGHEECAQGEDHTLFLSFSLSIILFLTPSAL